MSKPLIIIMSCLITIPAFGQMTLTMADYQAKLGSTQITQDYVSTDITGLQSMVNNSGANKTWDVTGRTYAYSFTDTDKYLAYPSGAPLANDSAFTSSNAVIRHTSSASSNIIWIFNKLDATGFYQNGFVMAKDGANDKFTESPPYLYSRFPLTFNTNWSITTLQTGTVSGSTSNTTMTYDDSVDAYGTIVTPEGSFPCLRLKEKNTSSITVLGQTITSTDYYYYFLDKNKYYARIYADSNYVPISVLYYTTNITTGIKKLPGTLPADFGLLQNYPNPFNPSTTIRFDLKELSSVTLEIFDILGERVIENNNGIMNAGRYNEDINMAGFASGTYLYRIIALGNDGERFVEVRKLMLVK